MAWSNVLIGCQFVPSLIPHRAERSFPTTPCLGPLFVADKAPRYISCKLKSQHKKKLLNSCIIWVSLRYLATYTPQSFLWSFLKNRLWVSTRFSRIIDLTLTSPGVAESPEVFQLAETGWYWSSHMFILLPLWYPIPELQLWFWRTSFGVPKDILQQGIYGALEMIQTILNHLIIRPRYKISNGFFPKWAMGPSDNHDLGVFGIPSLGSKIWLIEFIRGASKFEHPTCSWNHSHGI